MALFIHGFAFLLLLVATPLIMYRTRRENIAARNVDPRQLWPWAANAAPRFHRWVHALRGLTIGFIFASLVVTFMLLFIPDRSLKAFFGAAGIIQVGLWALLEGYLHLLRRLPTRPRQVAAAWLWLLIFPLLIVPSFWLLWTAAPTFGPLASAPASHETVTVVVKTGPFTRTDSYSTASKFDWRIFIAVGLIAYAAILALCWLALALIPLRAAARTFALPPHSPPGPGR